jgi:hypothetical protein
VASVGSIPVTMTDEDRFRFWLEVDQLIARGSNRINWNAVAPMIERRIPRVSQERGREIELTELRQSYNALADALVLACQSGRRELSPDPERMAAITERINELEAAQAAPGARP